MARTFSFFFENITHSDLDVLVHCGLRSSDPVRCHGPWFSLPSSNARRLQAPIAVVFEERLSTPSMRKAFRSRSRAW